MPLEVIDLLTDLRTYLQEKCEPPVYVSDRRLIKALNLLQASQYLVCECTPCCPACPAATGIILLLLLLLQHIWWTIPVRLEADNEANLFIARNVQHGI